MGWVNGMVCMHLVGDLGGGLKGGIRMEEDGSLVVFGAGVTD